MRTEHAPGGERDEKLQASLKRQELISALGVLAVGLGVGTLASPYLRSIAPALTFIGAGAHGWSMYRRRRLERTNSMPPVWWMETLYWACWLLLALLATYLIGRA